MMKKGRKGSIPIKENLHVKIIAALMIICVFGCLMVFSASSYTCAQKELYNYDSMYMLKSRQYLCCLVLGLYSYHYL